MLTAVYGIDSLRCHSLSGKAGPKLCPIKMTMIKSMYISVHFFKTYFSGFIFTDAYHERFKSESDEHERLEKFQHYVRIKVRNSRAFFRKALKKRKNINTNISLQ